VAVVAVIWLLLALTGKASAQQFGSKLAEVIPSDSDMVVIAPAATSDSQKWWESVSGFISSDTRVENVKPYTNKDFEVETYGYSRSKNHIPASDKTAGLLLSGPIQALYIESASDAGATKVQNWLKNTALDTQYDTTTTRVGNINIIFRQSSLDGYSVSMKNNVSSSISTRSDFKFQSPMMWINFDEQRTVLSTGGNDAKTAAIDEMYTNGLGISKGTVWEATSKDGGNVWAGNYVSGGVKASNIDSAKATSAFESDAKTVSSQTNKDDPNAPAKAAKTELSIVNPGLAAMLDYIRIDYSDKSKTAIGQSNGRPDSGSSLVAADLQLSAWNNLTGDNLGENGYSMQSIRASENNMSISFSKPPTDAASTGPNMGPGATTITK